MKITCLENGPCVLSEAVLTYLDKDGKEVEVRKVALCRCGHSNNKPFCDGQHKEKGFQAEELVLVG